MLFRDGGAHGGFHEAIGDAVTLSMTPGYLRGSWPVGLCRGVSEQADDQSPDANRRSTRLPSCRFGKLIDEWRWKVFSGEDDASRTTTRPGGTCDCSTRASRRRLNAPRRDFDPGAKYHVPGNVSYTRYFVARILQFQFQRSRCARSAGHEGATCGSCSVYGSKAAGAKLQATDIDGLRLKRAVAGHTGEADRYAGRWTRLRSSTTSRR